MPVFALQSFRKLEHGDFVKDGFLLFPSESKAQSFLDMCEMINQRQKSCHYEKYQSVEVNDFVTSRVNAQNNFFIRSLEQNKPELV